MDAEAIYERVREIATAFPGATVEEIDLHAGFSVRGRRFAWFLDDHHGDGMVAISCKAAPGQQQTLVARDPERYLVPAYLGARGWVSLRLDVGDPDWDEVAGLLEDAYRLNASKRQLAELDARTDDREP